MCTGHLCNIYLHWLCMYVRTYISKYIYILYYDTILVSGTHTLSHNPIHFSHKFSADSEGRTKRDPSAPDGAPAAAAVVFPVHIHFECQCAACYILPFWRVWKTLDVDRRRMEALHGFLAFETPWTASTTSEWAVAEKPLPHLCLF